MLCPTHEISDTLPSLDRLAGLVYLDALADPREAPGHNPRFAELEARTSLDELGPDEPQPRNDQERQALLEGAALFKPYADRWVGNLRKSVPDARIMELPPRSDHFVFITREADVLREIRAFVAMLK